jgi:hypothetical protein
MCKFVGETINHLLLHCLVAQKAVEYGVLLFRVSWVMSRGVVELLARLARQAW